MLSENIKIKIEVVIKGAMKIHIHREYINTVYMYMCIEICTLYICIYIYIYIHREYAYEYRENVKSNFCFIF